MTQHDHGHHHAKPHASGSGLHKNWVTWVVIGLMLAGMAVYVLTDDESLVPGEAPQPGMPAAAE
jgi:hypothetical protein